MPEPINVRFRYTEASYADGVRRHLAERFRSRLETPIAAAFVAPGAVFLVTGIGPMAGAVLVTLGALFLGLLALGWFWVPSRQYRTQPKLRDEYRLSFCDDGIVFKTEHVESNLQWTMFHRVIADERVYLLYYGVDAFTVLPRSVFPSGSDEATFRDLIKRKIPKYEGR
jgi:hypothetical protein